MVALAFLPVLSPETPVRLWTLALVVLGLVAATAVVLIEICIRLHRLEGHLRALADLVRWAGVPTARWSGTLSSDGESPGRVFAPWGPPVPGSEPRAAPEEP